MRHTNSDVFETGRQTQAGLQLFRSKRGSRHNRPNFLFKWRVPNGRLQGLGVFNLDPDKAGENEHGKELILQLRKKDDPDVSLVFLQLTVYWKQQGHF